VLRIGELLLRDERVVVEPVDQRLTVGADDLRLRVMDVGVDKARQDQRIGIGRHRRSRRQIFLCGGEIAEIGDLAVPDDDQRVLFVAGGLLTANPEGIVDKRQGRAAYGRDVSAHRASPG